MQTVNEKLNNLNTKKTIKPIDAVEVSFVVPQDQVNIIRQMAMRYILDNNNPDIAYKLIELNTTKLREDIKIWR